MNGRGLLLFSKTTAGLRFEGEMIYSGHHTESAPDRTGAIRQAIVFELRPLASVEEAAAAHEPDRQSPIDELRRRAFAASLPALQGKRAPRTIYERSADVRGYVLARAAGHCEGCGNPAPFVRADGAPYLEPHHLRRVSDGGPDDPRFVIGLCPTCHRRTHFGVDGADYNAALLLLMQDLERPPFPD